MMFDRNFVLFSIYMLSFFSPCTSLNSTNYVCGPLYITLKANPTNAIVLNWNFTCNNPPDTVRLVIIDNFLKTQEILKSIEINPSERIGSYKTHKKFDPKSNFPGNWNENDGDAKLHALCFNFAIESLRNGKIVDRKCFRIEPAWMARYSKLRLGSLMIPGTHDSGSYKGFLPIINNIIYTQNMDIYHQLVFGIRYFDFRTGVYDGEVYLNHNIARLTPMEPELDRIRNFLSKSPREIVIINVHKFPAPINFSRDDHKCVIDLIERKLGKFILERNERNVAGDGPILEDVWRSGRRVIVSYNDEKMVKEHSSLWEEVKREWGDEISLEKLEGFIMKKTDNNLPGNPMNVIMAELTPTVTYVAFHLLSKTLKDLADEVNPLLDEWLRRDNRYENVNIIATDYFLGNNMINLAMETNNKKIRSL